MLPLENRLSSRSDTGREELLPGVRAHLCGSHLSVRSTVCPRSRCERSLGHCPPSGPRISGNWSCGSAVAAVMRGAAWEMEFNPTEDPPLPPTWRQHRRWSLSLVCQDARAHWSIPQTSSWSSESRDSTQPALTVRREGGDWSTNLQILCSCAILICQY